MGKTSAGTVLQTYHALRTKIFGVKPPRFFRKGSWKVAEQYLQWCDKVGIDQPLGFLEYRFEVAKHYEACPSLIQLRSNKLAEQWHEWRGTEYDVQQWSEKKMREAGSIERQQLEALALLTKGQEAAKQPYFERKQLGLCVAELDFTGGFHPESRFCVRCPKAVQCSAALYQRYGFDVVQLRSKRFELLPPKIYKALVS